MTRAEKRRNLYTSSSKYRNWPRLGLWAVGLRSIGLAGLGAGLCKRNSVLNILGPRIGVNQLLRLYGRRFLQVKRPNQQYQSTEGNATKDKSNNENNKIHICRDSNRDKKMKKYNKISKINKHNKLRRGVIKTPGLTQPSIPLG